MVGLNPGFKSQCFIIVCPITFVTFCPKVDPPAS